MINTNNSIILQSTIQIQLNYGVDFRRLIFTGKKGICNSNFTCFLWIFSVKGRNQTKHVIIIINQRQFFRIFFHCFDITGKSYTFYFFVC